MKLCILDNQCEFILWMLQSDMYYSFSSGVTADYRLPADFLNGDTANIWFMVCCLLHAQTAELAKSHLCKTTCPEFTLQRPCVTVGQYKLATMVWFTTLAYNQLLPTMHFM